MNDANKKESTESSDSTSIASKLAPARRRFANVIVSEILPDQSILETLYDPETRRTRFILAKGDTFTYHDEIELNGHLCIPYSPENNLIASGIVLFPSDVAEYGTEDKLIGEIRSFIHRYVDVEPEFEELVAYYVLLTWTYDAFNELPYLRVRGDYGSGKTRFLSTIGSICYKPIFSSGASTVSPVFRILDAFRGTLIIDESDFRFSDESSELVKILNNGNSRGFPVLRSEVVNQREFSPRAYSVYGPKILATRGFFEDQALESRFLSEDIGLSSLREDIPINLSAQHAAEALSLRNKLLLYRFRSRFENRLLEQFRDPMIEPRLNQISLPLMSIVGDVAARERLRARMRRVNQEQLTERGQAREGQVAAIIKDFLEKGETRLTVKQITIEFIARHGEECQHRVTSKWIGTIIRKKLNIRTHKSNGVYVLVIPERLQLDRLFGKFGCDQAKSTTPVVPRPTSD